MAASCRVGVVAVVGAIPRGCVDGLRLVRENVLSHARGLSIFM